MTTAKDAMARPTSQHRLLVGSPASSLPSHKSRTHSHSLSMGSLSAAHRVSRRKSMSSSAHNNAAMAAVMREKFIESGRRPSKANLRNASTPGSLPHGGNGFGPSSYGGVDAKANSGTAITDGPPLSALPTSEKSASKARIRRASEGSRKRITNGELRCGDCGKGYKHSSCLTKHLWEHTPQWGVTSKLLISKHQQVQMLEAASVLVNMTATTEEDAKYSDHSSASPQPSSSDPREDSVSSTETSPPPEAYLARSSHRYSAVSSAYSQSYQSGNSIFSESAPSQGFSSHHRQWSNDGRPTTSGTSVAGSNYGEDDSADLAAAVNLLSCSHGSNKSASAFLPPDVPPVPPVPARYRSYTDKLSGSAATITPGKSPLPDQRAYSYYRNDNRDVKMREDDDSEDDFDQSRNRGDDHEELFRMEE